ncbi:exonuclease SbcC [Gillisia mitskevichiae]|uniref:Exonuclease SbcC n=1 Tax=Gillisia mitskevichiae TaxID=270921 RepID=A0A495PSQ3_9FLAO|nr:SbcC/MukB-like Walker B domain-containing protein [Gillisia mitskevichiae]RKS53653.1 exonuclease SbcC [Gillisia mitskevichiae]
MKILKIEFQNINSLRGEHQIDFTNSPFTESSLFAITGPTGSGKSTLLDVISLALFNQVPRLGKISRSEILNKGAILTRNQKEAYARVTYQCKYGIFSSQWSISTNRNEKLREYEMQISSVEDGAILDLKKSDVPGRNEELIGLNYNQFIKSVVLAQGDFAQFLRAKKDERGELLEKITGTGIYRKLGVKAFEKFKASNSDIKEHLFNIKRIEEELLSPEVQASYKNKFQEKTSSCEPLIKEVKLKEEQLKLKKEVLLQVSEVEKTKLKLDQASGKLKSFDTSKGLQLSQHEKLISVSEELRNWKTWSTEITSLDKERKSLQQKKTKNTEDLSIQLSNIQKFTKKPLTTIEVATGLEQFSNQVSALLEEKNNKGVAWKNLQQLLRVELKDVDLNITDSPDDDLEILERLKQISTQHIDDLKFKLKDFQLLDLTKERNLLRKDLEKTREAKNFKLELQQILNSHAEKLKEKALLLPVTKELPNKIAILNTRSLDESKNLQILELQKENLLMRAKLEDFRNKLIDQEPCPLCGSLHHPYAEHLPKKDDQLQQQIDSTKISLTALTKEIASLNSELKLSSTRLTNLDVEIKGLEENIKSKKSIFNTTFENYEIEEKVDWDKKIFNLEDQLNNLEAYEKQVLYFQAIERGIPILKEMQQILKDGSKLKQELSKLYSGTNIHTDCRDLENKWNLLNQQKEHLNESYKLTETKINEFRNKVLALEPGLLKELRGKGFTTIPEAISALLSDSLFNELRLERDSLRTEIASATTTLKVIAAQLEILRSKDVEENSEQLEEKLSAKQQHLKTLQDECKELERILKNHEDSLSKMKAIQLEIAEKEKQTKRWTLLNELIGDATGKKFNDFAQDLTLSQLLHLANIRLKDLSDRYLIDKPAADEDDGLVAIDKHMGGQRRSVKTLSGGETFILSLSLALALSDLASKNVEINSLFIDEGFGTLDPETLDQTLDTLERLQAESSKTIGIISHVDSLKERIGTQIKLTRNGQGYSSLEVVG